MVIFLNIVTLLLVFATSVVAIGGDTWKEGTDPLYKRILFRGWVSLGLLAVTLIVGLTKEAVDASLKRSDAIAAATREEALKRERDELAADLKTLRDSVASAEETNEVRHRALMEKLAALVPQSPGMPVISSPGETADPRVREIVSEIAAASAKEPIVSEVGDEETTILGTVTELNGIPVAGAGIRVMNAAGRLLGTAESNDAGEYLIHLRSGSSPLSAIYIMEGYEPNLVRGLAPNRSHEVNIVLARSPARDRLSNSQRRRFGCRLCVVPCAPGWVPS